MKRSHLSGIVCTSAVLAMIAAAITPSTVRAGFQWQIVTLQPPAGNVASSFAEPGIAFGANGSALANAATANTGAPPTVWRSSDSGDSWTRGSDFDTTAASTGDADAAIGADGYFYTLDVGYNPNPPAQPTNPTVLVFRSSDGATWQGPASFPPPHGADQPDRPWLFTDPLHAADVAVVHREGGGNIVLWRSQDHAASFTGPITVSSGANSQAALALSSRPLFDPTDDQRIFMLYETVTLAGLAATLSASPPVYEFPMTQIWLAVSTDAGATWSNHIALDTASLSGSGLQGGTLGHLLVASAVDASGNLYAAFSLRPSGGTETSIYVIHSTDHGTTWSAPAEIATTTKSNVMPAIAAGRDGALYVSWYGSTDSDYRDSAASWSEMFAVSASPLVASPMFDVSQLTSTPVHVGGIDSAGNVGFNLGANWGLRDFQSLAVDVCGRPHPVWAVDYGMQAAETAVPDIPCTLPTAAPEAGQPWYLVVIGAAATGSVVLARRRQRRMRGVPHHSSAWS